MMTRRTAPWIAAAGLALALAGPSAAGPFEEAFYARKDATAAEMLADRRACASEAGNVDLRQVAGYSDPRYGMLAAMAARLDSGELDTQAERAVRLAYLDRCMTLRGWSLVDLPPGEARKLKRASPAELDAWLKAHEPKPEPPAAPPPPPGSEAPAAAPPPTPVPAAPPAEAPATPG